MKEWDDDNEFCVECGESFRYDDCGGYNPPCSCGFHCRDCHDNSLWWCDMDDDGRDDYDDGDSDGEGAFP